MISKELEDEKCEKSAIFTYEFELRELWNLGLNFNKIILAGLKQYKQRAGKLILDDELFATIDELIPLLEYDIANEFEFKELNTTEIYTKLSTILRRLWY